MRAILRRMTVLLAAALCVPSAAAHAQNTIEPATTNTPATDSIGPRELQNFSLPGTTTRPADQPATTPTPTPSPSREATPVTAAPRSTAAAPPASRVASRQPPAVTPPAEQAPQATAVSPSLQLPAAPTPEPPLVSTPAAKPAEPPGTVAPAPNFSFLPWLVAALTLVAGALLLLWWRRPREALAAGPQIDLFVAPEPALPTPPSPPPEPKPVAATTISAFRKPAAPTGVVSARLRPSLEIAVKPIRCLVEESQVTIEFELELFNSGTAPARFVPAEASLLNASATQDQELAAFFANPAGIGDRVNSIPPMTR